MSSSAYLALGIFLGNRLSGSISFEAAVSMLAIFVIAIAIGIWLELRYW